MDYSTDILHAMPSGQATCAEQGHPHCISVMTCPQAESRLCLLKLHSLSVKYHIQLIRLCRPPTYITRDSEGSSYFKDTMAAHYLQNTLKVAALTSSQLLDDCPTLSNKTPLAIHQTSTVDGLRRQIWFFVCIYLSLKIDLHI